MVGCGIRRPELALVIHAKATPPPPPPPSIPPSPVCRGFTWIIPLPPALAGNSIDGPRSHTHAAFFLLLYFLTGRQHFYQKSRKGKKRSWCVKNNNILRSVLPGELHSKGLCHVFEAGNLCPRSFAAHHCNPISAHVSVRRGQHLHPAYPFMCHPLSAACAVCVPVSRAFSGISASTPVSGLKHLEMHFLHWTGFSLGRSFPVNNMLYYACSLIWMHSEGPSPELSDLAGK